MRFEGERNYALPPAALFDRLGDARLLVQAVPDATVTGTPTLDEAHCTVRPSFSFTRGNLDVTLRVADRQPTSALRFSLVSKTLGGGADVEVALQLTPNDAGTKVAWTAELVRLTGLLKMVPTGLIRGAAQKIIDDAWTALDRLVST
ncbi:MAG TPA: SRPBCC family protein [Gemmataceae bacterium]|jgi:carbon monoxide dehydrogenase subunit G|nr:SRPBCC family protein [Gemmataceae bacterium]